MYWLWEVRGGGERGTRTGREGCACSVQSCRDTQLRRWWLFRQRSVCPSVPLLTGVYSGIGWSSWAVLWSWPLGCCPGGYYPPGTQVRAHRHNGRDALTIQLQLQSHSPYKNDHKPTKAHHWLRLVSGASFKTAKNMKENVWSSKHTWIYC